MRKKVNELIGKQQRPAQSQYGMLEAFKINFVLTLQKTYQPEKKNSGKGCYWMLGTKILSYKEFQCKSTQTSEESEL